MRADPDPLFNFIQVEFQVCELHLALARNAHGDDRKAQHLRYAGKAYQTIVRFLPRLQLSRADLQALQQNLTTLRARLDTMADVSLENFGEHKTTAPRGHLCPPPAKKEYEVARRHEP